MAYKLIGQDIAIQVTFGALVDGSPTWGSPVTTIFANAKRVGVNEETVDADVTTLGDTMEKNRVKRIRATLDIEVTVPDGGRIFEGMVGQYVKVDIKELAANTTYSQWAGFVKSVAWEAGDDAQTERVSVGCGADGITYSSGFGTGS